MRRILFYLAFFIVLASALSVSAEINSTNVPEITSDELNSEEVGKVISQIPGLSENERINVNLVSENGSSKSFGIIIENNKLIEVKTTKLEDSTYSINLSE